MKHIESLIRDIEDFPKEGIIFKDITPLLNSSAAVNEVLEVFVSKIGSQKIDKVVGMESRGFLFGMLLAQKLNAGFVPVRKPGKLPYNTISESFSLEYGKDTLEIHEDAINKGDVVLIHDDVLATGGTALATTKLVERLEGDIVGYNFLIELDFLNGREKLSNKNIHSIFNY